LRQPDSRRNFRTAPVPVIRSPDRSGMPVSSGTGGLAASPLPEIMAVPWLQIVQLVPSIVEVSRDLLKATRRMPPPVTQPAESTDGDPLLARIQILEENERRQAELISQMAEQLAGLT